MNIQPELKHALTMIAANVGAIQIDPEFWDPAQPYYQVPNNHTMLMLRTYYQSSEQDEEFKQIYGPILDLIIWLYVTYPEWRARIGWATWFLQLYVIDKQYAKIQDELPPEMRGKWEPEIWTDPRKWILASGYQGLPVEVTPQRVVTLPEGPDDNSG